MNSKLHVVSDAKGRPIRMYLSAGQTSDYMGAAALLSSQPKATTLLADRGYRAIVCHWFKDNGEGELVSQRLDRSRYSALHPYAQEPLGANPARHCPLPEAPQDREHVRPHQRLANRRENHSQAN